LIFIFGLLNQIPIKGDKKIDQPGFPKANFVPIQYVVAVELVLLAESLGFSAATSVDHQPGSLRHTRTTSPKLVY
jgi:hypothetical protein